MTSRMILVAATVLFLAADAKEDNKKEIEKFKGSWKIESLEANAEKLDAAQFKDDRLVIEGDGKFTFAHGDEKHAGIFKVDASKKPKTIDITYTEGPAKDQTLLGIYELDGDTFKICLAVEAGKDRPTEWATKADSGHILEVLKREKKE